jgi:hypothetical protein
LYLLCNLNVEAMLFLKAKGDFFLMALGFELRTLIPSATPPPFFVMDFFFFDRVSQTICQELALNNDPPDLYLLSS